MADFEFPGGEADGGSGGAKKWLLWGAAGLVVILLLASRRQEPPAAMATAAGADPGTALEFARLQVEARREIAQLTATTRLRERELELAYALQSAQTPGAQRTCVTAAEWRSLPGPARAAYRRQERDGKAFIAAGPGGTICITPTSVGARGHEPLVRVRSRSGLFGGSASAAGPAGSLPGSTRAPEPGLGRVLEVLARIFGL